MTISRPDQSQGREGIGIKRGRYGTTESNQQPNAGGSHGVVKSGQFHQAPWLFSAGTAEGTFPYPCHRDAEAGKRRGRRGADAAGQPGAGPHAQFPGGHTVFYGLYGYTGIKEMGEKPGGGPAVVRIWIPGLCGHGKKDGQPVRWFCH